MLILASRTGFPALLLVFCLTGAARTLPAQAHSEDEAVRTIVEFHSGFWINLHHFLYRQAVAAAPPKGPHPLALNPSDVEEWQRLSAAEESSWNDALDYYKRSLITRDLLFDEGMRSIKNELEDAETSPDLEGAHLPGELKAALLKAAPIYRIHWWPRHDAQNRRWIKELETLVQKHGAKIQKALVRTYETPWPGEPVRVDAVTYANWAGAYTTIEPDRPTISTTEPANQGTAALEVVFHETSHGMIRPVSNAILEAEKAVNAQSKSGPVRFRRDLWHQVLFYTTGYLVAERIPSYVPFAEKNGLWNRVWTGHDRALIEQDWGPHVNGTAGLQQSLTKLVDDLAAARPQN